MNRLDELISFIKLTIEFQKIERVILIPQTDRWENDAEHSYQLALIAWYIIDKENLNLDKGKVAQLALVHDVVEVYAGDTFAYGNPGRIADKKQREAEAVQRLKDEFPEFPDLHACIHEYEDCKTPESKFVYALDKLLPAIIVFLEGGTLWRKHHITLEMIVQEKSKKVAVSDEINRYYHDFIEQLKQNRQLFPREELAATS